MRERKILVCICKYFNVYNEYTDIYSIMGLIAKDDKRYSLQNGIDTLPHGHYMI